MQTDFDKIMSQRTDEEIIEIVAIKRDDYQPEAVIAAEKELEKRGLSQINIEETKSDIHEKSKALNSLETSKASLGIRFINFIIDFICFLVFASLLSSLIGLFIHSLSEFFLQVLGFIIFLSAFFIYYVFLEHRYSQTVGKLLTKTKVVTKNGEKADLNTIIARTFYRLIPFDRLSFLFSKNGFHDRLSDTIVIKKTEANIV